MGVEPKIGVPPNHPFYIIGVSLINHPFWGTPIFGNIHIYIYIIWQYMDLPFVKCVPKFTKKPYPFGQKFYIFRSPNRRSPKNRTADPPEPNEASIWTPTRSMPFNQVFSWACCSLGRPWMIGFFLPETNLGGGNSNIFGIFTPTYLGK